MSQIVGLYLDTNPEEPPTLKTLSELVLSFDALAEEIAFVIDPSSKLILRVQSVEDGSISIRSIIEFAKEQAPSKSVCWAIIGTLLGWLAQDTRAYLTGEAVKKMIIEEQIDIPEKEAEEIADMVVKKLRDGVGRKQYREFLEGVESDKSIRGVGVITDSDDHPKIVFPRDDLISRLSQMNEDDESEPEKVREYEYRDRLVVISPVLIDSKDRRWKFSGPNYDFGAPVKDGSFLERVLSGKIVVPMTSGVIVDASYKIKEENTGGGWRPVYHEITEVHGVEAPMTQKSFSLNKDEE